MVSRQFRVLETAGSSPTASTKKRKRQPSQLSFFVTIANNSWQNRRKERKNMLILGLQKLSLLDYPGKIACTVFLGGCNFRCPYCHNGSLALGQGEAVMDMDEFLAFLDKRRGRLEGVCISGGEPTLHHDLPELIAEIKSRGYAVKLDTNGTNPEMLSSLINNGLIDYVAMDIKNSPDRYFESIGNSKFEIRNSKLIENVEASASILMQGLVDFEFRTTLTRELHSAEDMMKIGQWIQGAEKYFLQTYRDEGDLIEGGFTAYSREETEELLGIVKKYLPNAEIRG